LLSTSGEIRRLDLTGAGTANPKGFTEIVCLIGAIREKAMRAVNTVLIDLYCPACVVVSIRLRCTL
jgi:hypothetical protein